MLETVVVWILLGLVAVLALRSLVRTLTGKNEGCAGAGSSCGGACACPPRDEPSPREEETGQ